MKLTLSYFAFLLMILVACQSPDGPGDPKKEDPLPGELSAKSSKVFMQAQLNSQSWEAAFVQTKQSSATDSKGEYHIFTLIGREGEENSDPMISFGLTRYGEGLYKTGTYDIKDLLTNASDKYGGNLFYDAETLYSLDLNDPETYASVTIDNINGDKISGTFKLKLRAFNGEYQEFTNGIFESDNYTE